MAWFKRRLKLTANEFTSALWGAVYAIVEDYGPQLEAHYRTVVADPDDGQVEAEVFTLAFSLVAQVGNHVFREKRVEIGAALDLWMCEAQDNILQLPFSAGATRDWFIHRASGYCDPIMTDVRRIDEALSGERKNLIPFRYTIEFFLQQATAVPILVKQSLLELSVEALVPMYCSLLDFFTPLPDEISVEKELKGRR